MFISTSTSLDKKVGFENNLKLIKDAGFTAYDMGLTGGNENIIKTMFAGDDYLEKTYRLREYADSIGLPCNQSHAPFGAQFGDATKDSHLFQKTVRAMEVASILGAKGIVVHPMQFLHYPYHAKQLKEINYRFYSDLLPYAEKFGITILTENMWQTQPKSKHIIPSTCAWAEEFCEYIDMIGSPYLRGCLDIGHVILTGENLTRIITMLGADRLAALHIHDVSSKEDIHTIPFTRAVDFEEMITALKAIGYKGDLTFEHVGYEIRFPEPLYLSALRLAADIGHYFKSRLEEK